jgi:hypothetical protein
MIPIGRSKTAPAVLAVVLLLILGGCGTVGQLSDFKDLAGRQDYAAIAATDVNCEPAESGCNQLHLIKGDACFRLAKRGGEAEMRDAACAADELEKGIQATRDWKSEEAAVGKRAQHYENLCESLRLLQDNQASAEAAATNKRVSRCAQDFLAAEPDHLAAFFFVNSALFASFQLEPGSLKETTTACATLNGLLANLDRVQPRAAKSPYAANYERLRIDVTGLKRVVSGCR